MKIETSCENCTGVRSGWQVIRLGAICFLAVTLLCLTAGRHSLARAGDDASQVRLPGATLRLSLMAPEPDGFVRGVLSIDLEPGWKTYWTDPGPVGLAPSFDFRQSRGLGPVSVRFPAPVRFDEGGVASVGYTEPLLLPLSTSHVGSAPLQAIVDLTLGLCRELCVPITARLEAEASASLSTKALVLAAARDIPVPGDPAAVRVSFDGSSLTVQVDAADVGNAPDVFLDSSGTFSIGSPHGPAARIDGLITQRFPASVSNAENAVSSSIDVVLTSGETARSYEGIPVTPVSPAGARP
ncbi:DsbC/DsbD-like thiol-disulfide interchange protein [Aureimonas jatrophae]|uniref:Thiol-disulfide interchange protein, contains DsbC and DsbD domains n=1 Tax=Aureimonas jatrophae TaxID=1166073 RepID=A0A1H0GP26_9HYPH|nr:DsbC/DsbD-like thiol-disulfide interchange protein [Aureimonas jatrophae]SDO08644.1 Thiol-disulfide interchange protein, contains DsbC and DsbD domains [Aureimonas jatrophae]